MTDMEFKVDLKDTGDFRSYSPSSNNNVPVFLNRMTNSQQIYHRHQKIISQDLKKQDVLEYFPFNFISPFSTLHKYKYLREQKLRLHHGNLTSSKMQGINLICMGLFGFLQLLSSYCAQQEIYQDKDQFLFRLELLRYSVIIIYGFGFGFPALLGLAFRLFSCQITVPQIMCLYGYSLSCFIPILLLCIIPAHILQWVLLVYGIINSSLFMILNIRGELDLIDPSRKYIVYAIIGVFQITLVLLFKLLFFNMIYT